MLTNKHSVNSLVAICAQHKINHVVISPGSRNAPLTIAFAAHKDIECYSIADERSAAFYALGMALKTKKTVAIVCTSGSAALNYAPAIAEAYYQGIPLLVLTADRPVEVIDQMEGQAIRQNKIFENYIKASFQFLQDTHDTNSRAYNERISNESIQISQSHKPGPVHINIPLKEPLYEKGTNDFPKVRIIKTPKSKIQLDQRELNLLCDALLSSKKVMILSGQMDSEKTIEKHLSILAKNDNIVVLTERTSNIHAEDFIYYIDRNISSMQEKEIESFSPELLITFGQDIVSKKIKAFLRNIKDLEHWHIDSTNKITDTYFSLTKHIKADLSDVFEYLAGKISPVGSSYKKLWHRLDKKTHAQHEKFLQNCDYSDLYVWNNIVGLIPTKTELHLANSTPIRYIQLCNNRSDIIYRSNRGTSGIDGSISTAAGASLVSDEVTTIISGDLSFLYDSNALWNKHVPKNLKIIVINNKGGGIFRFIDGPEKVPGLMDLFTTPHNVEIKSLAKAFNCEYLSCSSKEQLESAVKDLYAYTKGTCVLEIFTPENTNAETLKSYFKFLKNSTPNV